MFEYKHHIQFADGSSMSLFGPDYWMDKRVFHSHHWSLLEGLREKVGRTGYPVTIEDAELKTTQVIHSKEELQEWFKEHQPVEFKL